jgi:putative PIN family toxin of toxin-antitoxin system
VVRATFDTPIIVRMVLGKATTLVGKLRRALEQEQFTLVLSPALAEEVTHTLKSPHLRNKHGWTDEAIDQFVNDLKTLATMTAGALIPDIPQLAKRDPEDIKVVAAAVEGSASFVVTQDKDLLDLGEYQSVRMIEPPEFYQILHTLEAERSNGEEQTA